MSTPVVIRLPGATSAWERDAGIDDIARVAEAADGAEFYRYDGMVLDPCAVQPHAPIWIGGRTIRSLRRATTLADGGIPFGPSSAELSRMLAAVDLPDYCQQLAALRALADGIEGVQR